MTLHSEPGRGSRFVVSLPAAACPQPEQAAAPVAAGRSRRVLLVEDNAVNRLVATRLLQKLGHRVRVEEDGARALAAIEQEPFDVVLVDCHMLVMDVYEATRALRARGFTLPVFALTAAVITEDCARCIDAGMNDFIPKPLDAAQRSAVLASVSPSAPSR